MPNHFVTFGEAGLINAASGMRGGSEFSRAMADAVEGAAWEMIEKRERAEYDACQAKRHPDTAHFYPVAHPND